MPTRSQGRGYQRRGPSRRAGSGGRSRCLPAWAVSWQPYPDRSHNRLSATACPEASLHDDAACPRYRANPRPVPPLRAAALLRSLMRTAVPIGVFWSQAIDRLGSSNGVCRSAGAPQGQRELVCCGRAKPIFAGRGPGPGSTALCCLARGSSLLDQRLLGRRAGFAGGCRFRRCPAVGRVS